MKKVFKRINVLLLAAVMLLTSVVPAFAADDAVQTAVSDAQYAKDLLSTLGIIDTDDNADLNEQMSRAEFAVVLCRFAGIFTPSGSSDNRFRDVLTDSYEKPYIYTAVDAGFIQAVSSDYFYPAWAISATDAARSMLMCLGYGDLAKESQSFVNFSQNLKLYNDVDTENFTRGDVYKMVYNALHAQVMNQVDFGDDAKYEQLKDINGLYKYHGVIRTRGTITGAGGISLGAGSNASLSEDFIELDGVRFRYPNHDMNSIIGREVWLYWTESTGGSADEAIYIEVIEDSVFTLHADEIISFSGTTYQYEKDNKVKKFDLNSPYVIYNGEEYEGSFTSNIMIPENGDVTIVENNDGGDVVIIRSYEDYVVKNVITEEYIILGYNSGERIDLGEYIENVKFFTSNGIESGFTKIAPNMVISIARSASEKNAVVYISEEVVEGNISQKSSSGNKWTIGDKTYNLSGYILNLIESGVLSEPDMRSTYKFYINTSGQITYYTDVKTKGSLSNFYAVITGIDAKEGLSDDVSLKIFSKTLGGFEIYPCAKKLTLNGEYEERSAVIEALKKDGRHAVSEGKFVAQPVVIGLNEANEINYILQAGDKNNDDGLGFFLFAGSALKSASYRAYRNVLAIDDESAMDMDTTAAVRRAHLGASTDTEFIQIPYFAEQVLDENNNLVEESSIDVASEKSFIMASRPTGSFKMFAYVDELDDLCASFVILATAAGEMKNVGSKGSVVTVVSYRNIIHEENEVIEFNTGTRKYYIDNPNINLDKLKMYDNAGEEVVGRTHKVVPGDRVAIVVDSLGYIQAMEIVYSVEQNKMMGVNSQAQIDTWGEEGPPRTNANNTDNTAYNSWQTDNFWFNRNSENQMYLMNLYKVDDGYFMAVEGDPAEYVPGNARRFIGYIPNVTILEQTRTGATYRNATAADLISYMDSAEDYVTVLISTRYAQLTGVSIVNIK